MRIHLAILATLAICTAAVAETPRVEAIDKAVQEQVDKKEIAGALTLVANKDGIVHLGTVGLADIEGKREVRADTIFWIASMTKNVTAAGVMMLVDEGKISIDDPVSKYIPELANLKMEDGTKPVITIKHCLTHTSGMSDITYDESTAAKSLTDIVSHITERPIKFAPGNKWEYNQAGINTCARIIEIVSKLSYPEFCRKKIFEPLGMSDTTFYPSDEQMKRLAKSYKKDGDNFSEAEISILHGNKITSKERYPAANGGLFTTAADWSKFLRMLLRGGELDGKRLLKEETVKQMTTIQTGDLGTGFTPGCAWGLGLGMVKKPQGVTAMLSPGTYGHGGAFGTQGWVDPERGLVLILMVERSNFPNADATAVRRAFQQAAVDAFPKK